MKLNLKPIFRAAALLCTVAVFSFGLFLPAALASGSLSLASDTNVLLSGSGITLTLASGSTLVSYAAGTTTLTVNLDSNSSVTVKSSSLYTLTNSQSLPTLCSGTNYSYVALTATTTTAVTITPTTTSACTGPTPTPTPTPTSTGGGGGGGGAAITLPVISSFTASPASIEPGASSTLAWTVSGASTITINPTISTTALNALSGTAMVTPAGTTTFVLTAANSYNQTVSASTTVTVTGSSLPVTPATPAPSPTPPSSTGPSPAPSAPAYCLVNYKGTFSLILSGTRRPIANPGLLYSYGYGFGDAVPDTAAYQSLAVGSLLGPNDGALVKAPKSSTVYLISGGAKHGFTSAKVFQALGYKFSSVLTIPAPQLEALASGPVISSSTARHLEGANIKSGGTIYWLSDTARFPYPSLAVFNTWNLHNDFSGVLPANAADLLLPVGSPATARPNCTSQ